jgi:hypothetical protein
MMYAVAIAWFTNLKDLQTCKVKTHELSPKISSYIYEFSNDLMIDIMIIKDSILIEQNINQILCWNVWNMSIVGYL